MASPMLRCTRCGMPRTSRPNQSHCAPCKAFLSRPLPTAEPWTAGYVRRGLIYHPIKEHA